MKKSNQEKDDELNSDRQRKATERNNQTLEERQDERKRDKERKMAAKRKMEVKDRMKDKRINNTERKLDTNYIDEKESSIVQRESATKEEKKKRLS